MRRILKGSLSAVLLIALGYASSLLFQPAVGASAQPDQSAFLAAVTPAPGQKMVDGLAVPNEELVPQAPPAALATGQPVYYRTYGALEFHPNGSDLQYSPTGAGMFALSLGTSGNSFKKQLELPNGAQVSGITAYVIDNDGTQNVRIEVTRNTPSLNASQTYLIALETSNTTTSTSVQAISVSGAPLLTVDNNQYVYALRYQPSLTGSNHILVAVRVEYSVPISFLPSILK
jgi:hypothetical protein